MEGDRRVKSLGLINNGSLLEILMCSAVFDDDVSTLFFTDAYEVNLSSIDERVVKELVNACAIETSKRIVGDLGDDFFGIVVDMFLDREGEYHLAVCLRYVDSRGKVVERFLGVVHVSDMTAVLVKSAIDSLLRKHSVSLSKIRGQSYNEVSSLSYRMDFNSLKALMMEEEKSAHCIQCYGHELQSILSAVVERKISNCCSFFGIVEGLVDLLTDACRQKEIFEQTVTQKVLEAFELNVNASGNRLCGADNAGCVSYQYKTLVQLVSLFPTVLDVLDVIRDTSLSCLCRSKAKSIMEYEMFTFEFAFVAHVMASISGYTNELSLALQRNDILNALSLVSVVKSELQKLRDYGWESLFSDVCAFCARNEIEVPDMNACYISVEGKTYDVQRSNLHHFKVDTFFRVIDVQLEELNSRFSEVNMELLACIVCSSPVEHFSSFDRQKLIRLAEFYPNEFPRAELSRLGFQLDEYIVDMRKDDRFWNLNGLDELCVKLVETKKHNEWPQVYLLLKLVLILPLVTASEERIVSAMSCMRAVLRNCDGDLLLNSSLITSIEKDVFAQVSDDDVLKQLKTLRALQKQE